MHKYSSSAKKASRAVLSLSGVLVLSLSVGGVPAFAAESVQDPVVTNTSDAAAETPLPEEAEQMEVYTVSVTTSAGGVVGITNENGEVVPLAENSVQVEVGSSQNFVLLPEVGFVVGSVTYNDEVHEGLLNSFSITPASDTSLSVAFLSEEEAGLIETEPGFHKTENGLTYYRDADGKLVFGRVTIEGNVYVFRSDGFMLTGWQSMSEGRFYFGSDGKMRTGWETIGSEKYYFDARGVVLTGWHELDDKYYYFRSGGSMAVCVEDGPKTGWVCYEGTWYWFDSEGILKTGWQYIGDKWYFLRANGAMVTGWQAVDSKWYYFGTSGNMHRGWVFVDGWYYLGEDGAMRSGWFWVDGSWYATSKSGRILMDTWGNDGTDTDYYFGPSGAWTGQERKHVG